MTTKKEVRALVAPLLDRNSDLVLVGRLLVMVPVHHFVRGIFIDRTGQARQCQPRWMMMHLLSRQEDIMLDAGDLLYRKGPYKPGLWWLDDLEVPSDLVKVAEQDVLPKLRSVQSLQDYLDVALPKDPAELKFCWGLRFVFAMALGDLDAARGFLESDMDCIYARRLNTFRGGLGDRLLEHGTRLSAEDRALLAAYLHECEEYTVNKLKIGHIWERKPFPIEVRPGGNSAIT